jgi:hypothetical protein
MHFVTDQTAKGVLRGIIRDFVARTPNLDIMCDAMELRWYRFLRNPLKTVNKCREMVQPYAFSTHVAKVTDGYVLDMLLIDCRDNHDSWVLSPTTLNVKVTLQSIDFRDSSHFFGISGHALERLFQRANVIAPNDVIKEVSAAVKLVKCWGTAVHARGFSCPKQIVIPTHRGVFIGSVAYNANKDGINVLAKTYLPDGSNERFDAVKREFKVISDTLRAQGAMTTGAKSYDTELQWTLWTGAFMVAMIKRHPWLLEEYQPPV